VEDVKSLVAMLIQTEKLGTSLAQSLRVHSDSLRTRRRQKAEEAAAKTTIKLVFPLVFLMFPALFIVILGPGVLQIIAILLPTMGSK
jgi:tight adherence protein C